MLLDDETAVHECLAELPSTEVVENFIKAIKNVYPSLEIVVHPEDLEIQEECWCIKPTSLDRLARQYESFLAETLGRLRKELEQIPAKIEELR